MKKKTKMTKTKNMWQYCLQWRYSLQVWGFGTYWLPSLIQRAEVMKCQKFALYYFHKFQVQCSHYMVKALETNVWSMNFKGSVKQMFDPWISECLGLASPSHFVCDFSGKTFRVFQLTALTLWFGSFYLLRYWAICVL